MRRKEGWTRVGIRADESRGSETTHDKNCLKHSTIKTHALLDPLERMNRAEWQTERKMVWKRDREGNAMETNDAPEGQRHPTQEPGRLPQSRPAPSTHTRAHRQGTDRTLPGSPLLGTKLVAFVFFVCVCGPTRQREQKTAKEHTTIGEGRTGATTRATTRSARDEWNVRRNVWHESRPRRLAWECSRCGTCNF